MRCLAVARYVFLTTVRRTMWLVALLMSMALVPVFVDGGAMLVVTNDRFVGYAPFMFEEGATSVMVAYVLNLGFIMALGGTVSSRNRSSPAASDLMDTALITGQTNFWGNALGISASMFVMHACCVPMLAELVALSPYSPSVFWWLELMIVVLLLLAGSAAAWHRLTAIRKGRALRFVQRIAIFTILFIVIVTSTTRIDDFYDGILGFLSERSPRSWAAVPASVDHGAILVVLLVALLSSFLALLANDAARVLDEA